MLIMRRPWSASFTTKKKIMLVDGHVSHTTLEAIPFTCEHVLYLISLIQKCTHIGYFGHFVAPYLSYIVYSNTTTRGHHLQLQQHHCRIKSYQHSFFPSVVNMGLQLSSDTVGAASLNLFQNRLAPSRCIKPYHFIWTMLY